MTETQVAAQPAQPQALSVVQAAEKFAERRAAASPANQVSDAARTLGQQAAKAREERKAAAAAEAQKPPVEEGSEVEDDQTPAGEALNDTATTDTPTPEEADTQDDPEARTIDLGDGVNLPVAEVREMIMLKADHTKRLQAMAEDRKKADALYSQKLTQLDKIVSTLSEATGKPKSLKELIAEHGPIDAVEKYAEQEEKMQRLGAAQQLAESQRNEWLQKAFQERDRHLAEHYNPDWADAAKRDAAYTELTGFALKRGMSPEAIRQMTEPAMIEILDLALQHVKTKEGAAKVTKLVSEKPKVVKPGAKVGAGAAALSNVQRAEAQLKQSGSFADAVKLLQARRGTRG